jgi:hypothetical protein
MVRCYHWCPLGLTGVRGAPECTNDPACCLTLGELDYEGEVRPAKPAADAFTSVISLRDSQDRYWCSTTSQSIAGVGVFADRVQEMDAVQAPCLYTL